LREGKQGGKLKEGDAETKELLIDEGGETRPPHTKRLQAAATER
jgi:hypothetical protein